MKNNKTTWDFKGIYTKSMVGAALSRLIKFLETFTEHNNVIYNENYLNKLMYFIIYMYIYILYIIMETKFLKQNWFVLDE